MTGSRAEQAAGAAAADEADVKQLALSDVGRSQVVEARKTKGPKSRIDATTNDSAMMVLVFVVAKGKRKIESRVEGKVTTQTSNASHRLSKEPIEVQCMHPTHQHIHLSPGPSRSPDSHKHTSLPPADSSRHPLVTRAADDVDDNAHDRRRRAAR